MDKRKIPLLYIKNFLKYIIIGIIVAISCRYIPTTNINNIESREYECYSCKLSLPGRALPRNNYNVGGCICCCGLDINSSVLLVSTIFESLITYIR